MTDRDLYSDAYALGIAALYAGRGTGAAPWNPEKVLSAIRNLARWQSRRALTRHSTKLWCEVCQAVQPVIDYKPLANLAVLSCHHGRSISTMSDTEYAELVSRASGLSLQRNAVRGGFEVVQTEAA